MKKPFFMPTASTLVLLLLCSSKIFAYNRICMHMSFGVGYAAEIESVYVQNGKESVSGWSYPIFVGQQKCFDLPNVNDDNFYVYTRLHAIAGTTVYCYPGLQNPLISGSGTYHYYATGTTYTASCEYKW